MNSIPKNVSHDDSLTRAAAVDLKRCSSPTASETNTTDLFVSNFRSTIDCEPTRWKAVHSCEEHKAVHILLTDIERVT